MDSAYEFPFYAGVLLARQARAMDDKSSPRRPGDLFLERYMPTATETEREAARENLRTLVAILVEIDDRLSREKRRKRDSRESKA